MWLLHSKPLISFAVILIDEIVSVQYRLWPFNVFLLIASVSNWCILWKRPTWLTDIWNGNSGMLTSVLKSPKKRVASPPGISCGGKGMLTHAERRLKFFWGFYKLSSGLHRENRAVEQCEWFHVSPLWNLRVFVSAPSRALLECRSEISWCSWRLWQAHCVVWRGRNWKKKRSKK